MNINSILAEFAKDDLMYYFLPIFIVALVLEWGYSRERHPDVFDKGDTKASLWMMLFVGIVDVAPKILAFFAF